MAFLAVQTHPLITLLTCGDYSQVQYRSRNKAHPILNVAKLSNRAFQIGSKARLNLLLSSPPSRALVVCLFRLSLLLRWALSWTNVMALIVRLYPSPGGIAAVYF